MKKYLSIILLFLIILTVAYPINAQSENTFKAKVITIEKIEEVKENNLTKKVQNVKVRILDGEYENEEHEMLYVISEDISRVVSNVELKKDDNISVEIEEKDGEVINIIYKETINQNYILYIVCAISLTLILVIGRGKVIKSLIIYLTIIFSVICIFAFSIQKGWDLILISNIISLFLTICILTILNGMNKKTFAIILCAMLSIEISGILINVLFDAMKLMNINIQIKESLISIKQLICSTTILFSCGICNVIIVSMLDKFSYTIKSYKTKSDNIIEGQRSLKL